MTKFSHGAWITIIVIPAVVLVFTQINKHYKNVARILSLGKVGARPSAHAIKTIVLVDDVHRGTVRVIDFAKSLGRDWTPVHVDYSDRKTEAVQKKWRERIGERELLILRSPYRRLVEPIRDYIQTELDKDPSLFVHVIMGQLVMDTPWAKALHANNSLGIIEELQSIDRVIVTDVPYQLHADDIDQYPPNEANDYQPVKEAHPNESMDAALS